MLPPFAAVIVYDGASDLRYGAVPAFCVIAHNLERYDANRLAERLVKQYDLDAHVVLHRNRHDFTDAVSRDVTECPACGALFEDIIKQAAEAA